MIQDFSFAWAGRRWHGYFNAISNNTLIAHFEDEHIRETIGASLTYYKTATGTIHFKVNNQDVSMHTPIYDAVLKGVESRLGRSLARYLN